MGRKRKTVPDGVAPCVPRTALGPGAGKSKGQVSNWDQVGE